MQKKPAIVHAMAGIFFGFLLRCGKRSNLRDVVQLSRQNLDQ